MRKIMYRANGSEHSIMLYTGRLLAQRIPIDGMTPDQRSETMALAIQWMRSRTINAAHTVARRKARILDDTQKSERVASYATTMTEVTAQRAERRREAKMRYIEEVNKE